MFTMKTTSSNNKRSTLFYFFVCILRKMWAHCVVKLIVIVKSEHKFFLKLTINDDVGKGIILLLKLLHNRVHKIGNLDVMTDASFALEILVLPPVQKKPTSDNKRLTKYDSDSF